MGQNLMNPNVAFQPTSSLPLAYRLNRKTQFYLSALNLSSSDSEYKPGTNLNSSDLTCSGTRSTSLSLTSTPSTLPDIPALHLRQTKNSRTFQMDGCSAPSPCLTPGFQSFLRGPWAIALSITRTARTTTEDIVLTWTQSWISKPTCQTQLCL